MPFTSASALNVEDPFAKSSIDWATTDSNGHVTFDYLSFSKSGAIGTFKFSYHCLDQVEISKTNTIVTTTISSLRFTSPSPS